MLNIFVYIMKYVCWHGKYCTYSFVCCGMLFNLSMSHACSPLGSPFSPQYFVTLKIRGNNIAIGVTSVFNLLGLLIDFKESNVNSPTTKVDNSQYPMFVPQIDRNIYDISLRLFQRRPRIKTHNIVDEDVIFQYNVFVSCLLIHPPTTIYFLLHKEKIIKSGEYNFKNKVKQS